MNAMPRPRLRRFGAFCLIGLFLLPGFLAAQSRGLKLIRAEDMRGWLEFLSAREFEGRNAPSTAYNIAARYVALEAKRIGLKPLLPGGEWFQPVAVEVTTISPAKSRLRVIGPTGEQAFAYPQAFGASPRGAVEGAVSGGLIFIPPLPVLQAAELDKALELRRRGLARQDGLDPGGRSPRNGDGGLGFYGGRPGPFSARPGRGRIGEHDHRRAREVAGRQRAVVRRLRAAPLPEHRHLDTGLDPARASDGRSGRAGYGLFAVLSSRGPA